MATVVPMRKGKWTQLGEAKLLSSGLTTQIADKLGMYEVVSAATLHKSFEARPALVIPYFDFKGDRLQSHPKWDESFYRIRYLDVPVKGFNGDEKVRRYAQEPGLPPAAFFPKTMDWAAIAADSEVEILITEGELKAAAACVSGYPTIGLGGVWNFKSNKEGWLLLPEMQRMSWARRVVYICYDSDYATNANICAAINHLRDELQERGAIINTILLPPADDGKKQGIDDYLLDHSTEEFNVLIKDAESVSFTASLWKMNNEVAYIRNPGLVIDLKSGQRMNTSLFKNESDYATRSTIEKTVSKEGEIAYRKVNAAQLWVGWPMRNSLGAITYAPGQARVTDHEEYNQWPGWGTKPEKGDIKPWLELTKHVFADCSKEELEWFYDWCAYPIQNPGVKMFSAVVVHGVHQGTGKSVIGYTLGQIYGKNFKEITDTNLEADYTDWAENRQFIMGDEISGNDSRASANKLKRLITQESVTINIKYVPQYTVPDCINYYFSSQHVDSFFLEDTDRRFFIVEVVGAPMPAAFYKKYDTWRKKDGGAEALHHWLATRQISKDFDPAGHAPKTKAKERMIHAGKSDVDAWLAELRAHPDDILVFGKHRHMRDMFTAKELLSMFETAYPKSSLTAMGLGKKLNSAGFHQVDGGTPLRGPEGTGRYFAIRNAERWAKCTSRKELERNIAQPMEKKR